MTHFIRNPDFPNYAAFSHHVNAMLGLSKSAKLPQEGMAPRFIQGIKVWVNPLALGPVKHKRSTHRVMAECPTCGRHLSVGRLRQHKCEKPAPEPTEPASRVAHWPTLPIGYNVNA